MAITITPVNTISGNVFNMNDLVFEIYNTDFANTDLILDIYIRSSTNAVTNTETILTASNVTAIPYYLTREAPTKRILLENYNNLLVNTNPAIYKQDYNYIDLAPIFLHLKEKGDIINNDIYFFLQVSSIKKTKAIRDFTTYYQIEDTNILENTVRFPAGSGVPVLIHKFDNSIANMDTYTNVSYKTNATKINNNNYKFNIYFNLTKSTLTTLTPTFINTLKVINDETGATITTITDTFKINRYATRFKNIIDNSDSQNNSFMTYTHNITTSGNRLPRLKFEMSCPFFANKLIVYSSDLCTKFNTDNLLYLSSANAIQVIPVIKYDKEDFQTQKFITKTSYNNSTGIPIFNTSDTKYTTTNTLSIFNVKKEDIEMYKEMLSSTVLILEENNTFKKISLQETNFDLLTFENNKKIESLVLKYKYI